MYVCDNLWMLSVEQRKATVSKHYCVMMPEIHSCFTLPQYYATERQSYFLKYSIKTAMLHRYYFKALSDYSPYIDVTVFSHCPDHVPAQRWKKWSPLRIICSQVHYFLFASMCVHPCWIFPRVELHTSTLSCQATLRESEWLRHCIRSLIGCVHYMFSLQMCH